MKIKKSSFSLACDIILSRKWGVERLLPHCIDADGYSLDLDQMGDISFILSCIIFIKQINPFIYKNVN